MGKNLVLKPQSNPFDFAQDLRYNSLMQINFYPERDNPKFEKAAKEYAKIWTEGGDNVVKVIEKTSELKFKEKTVNAIIHDEISYYVPLKLQADISTEHKKGTLVHELCHRLVVGNNIKIKTGKTYNNWTMAIHKHIDLILYDIWVGLYGESFAKKEIDYEISLWTGKGISPYKTAWDWALKMTKEQRQKEFRKYFEK